MLELLINRGVSLNDPTTNDGCSPLHLAADNGNSNVVFWLVDHGADIRRKNDEGYVAADLARISGHKSLAKYLRSREYEVREIQKERLTKKCTTFCTVAV